MRRVRSRTRLSHPGHRVATPLVLLVITFSLSADPARDDFFEAKIRPLLAEQCIECHGAKKAESGLRLDSREGALKGGDRGAAIEPGKPSESLLLSAVRHEDDLEMPPEKKLSDEQINSIATWIEQGALWPASPSDRATTKKDPRDHWAFKPVADPPIPISFVTPAGNNPIDAFVQEKLAPHGRTMSNEADPQTLVRRATYDLTGLPPSMGEVMAYEEDSSIDRYDRLIDRLLASPHHGEQWARHWLDVARYSDTKGYVYAREERFFVHAWPYRDWVVRAFNEDMPYDRFVLLQLAADQIAPDEPREWPAMGYLTLGRRFLGVTHDIIDDRIDVVTRGLLGLTASCARCHDHKFDPIPTADYYSLYGVFKNGTEELKPIEPVADPNSEFEEGLTERITNLESKRAFRRAEAADRARTRLRDYLLAQLELEKWPEEGFDIVITPDELVPFTVRRWRDYLHRQTIDGPVWGAWKRWASVESDQFVTQAERIWREMVEAEEGRFHPSVVAAFPRSPRDMREVATRYAEILENVVKQEMMDRDRTLADVLFSTESPCEVPDEAVVSIEFFFTTDVCNELWKLQGEVDRWLIQRDDARPFAVTMADRTQMSPSRIFRRGNPAQATTEVPRQFLGILAGSDRKPFANGSGRLELARAIIDPANSLPARVMVNRFWQHHFGSGLVTTPSDFGTRSEPPSHPELLDWLARYWTEEGSSPKSLHRLMVTSAAYRQRSHIDANDAEFDPANRLLARANPRRLSFEELRDSLLLASGDLSTSMQGKPADMFALDNHRRSLYGLVDREFFPSALRVFDFANPDLHIPTRIETTVPQQALFFLNHPLLIESAKRFAANTVGIGDPQVRLERMIEGIFHRKPYSDERELAISIARDAFEPTDDVISTTARDWTYGYAPYDPEKGLLGEFKPLPHFTGKAWQGGGTWPDPAIGWAQLSAEGGHPGNDLDHVVVRRWTAPRDMTLRITSTLKHEREPGDGIRATILHSVKGVLASATVHNSASSMNVDSVEVAKGQAIDFVVDILSVLNSDEFTWSPTIEKIEGSQPIDFTWRAQEDFAGPVPARLDPWEQLAQVLLMTNEFLFVD